MSSSSSSSVCASSSTSDRSRHPACSPLSTSAAMGPSRAPLITRIYLVRHRHESSLNQCRPRVCTDLSRGDRFLRLFIAVNQGESMFERFKQNGADADDPRARSGSVATAGNGEAPRRAWTAVPPAPTADTMRDVRARQREEYGGINWGAAFFGWLVAVGVAVLLTGLLAAAGAAIGLTESRRRRPAPRRCRSAARSRCSPCSPSPTTAAATSPGACRASTAPARASAPGSSGC